MEAQMSALYIIAAQPNPPGRDTVNGTTTNNMLNQEWVEFMAVQKRNLSGDVLSHLTFDRLCQITGSDDLIRFSNGELKVDQHVRVHTGQGSNYWDGDIYHMYAGRSWYVWNNACGDRATLSYDNRVIDSAFYRPNPPEGILARRQGTDELVPAGQLAYRR